MEQQGAARQALRRVLRRDKVSTDSEPGGMRIRPPQGGAQGMVVAGHSHVRALQQGLDAAIDAGTPALPDCTVICEFRGTYTVVRYRDGRREHETVPSMQSALEAAVGGADVAILWGGNAVTMRSLVERPPPFDVVLADDPPARQPLGVVIPCDVVASAATARLAEPLVGELVEAHRAGVVRRLALLVPPPPLPLDATRSRLASSPYFAKELSALGLTPEDAPLVPAEVRVRLWRLVVDAYQSFATEHGLDFIGPPDGVTADDGTLLAQFHDQDVTHANADYGARYLELVTAGAGARAGAPAGRPASSMSTTP